MLLHAGKHPDPNGVVLRPIDPKSKPRVLNPNASLINRKKSKNTKSVEIYWYMGNNMLWMICTYEWNL